MAESQFGISRIEPLNSKNYALWNMRVGALIKSKHLYDVISQEGPVKNENDVAAMKVYNEWLSKNDEAYGIIILTLSAEQVMTVRGITNAKELWDLLKRRHEGLEKQRKINLKIKLAKVEKYDRETIEEYLIRTQTIANEISDLGTQIEESELIGYIIEGLPKKYSEVVTAVLSNPDMSYELMRETLLRYERKYDKIETETKAFKTNEFKGRSGNCYSCGKFGHKAVNCWNKQKTPSYGGANNFYRGNTKNQLHRSTGFQHGKQNSKHNDYTNKSKKEHSCFIKEHALQTRYKKDPKLDNYKNKEVTWILDSACSSHMTCEDNIIINPKFEEVEVTTAEQNRSIQSKFRGNVKATFHNQYEDVNINLGDVLYVPNLSGNLLSASSLIKKGKQVILDDEGAYIYEKKTGEMIAQGSFEDNSFLFKFNIKGIDTERCQKTVEISKEMWHKRLGHVNYSYLDKMIKKNLVRGIDILKGEEKICEACIQGKLTRFPFHQVTEEKSKQVLERLHVDLCGPMSIESLGKSRYMLLIIDEYSRRYFVEFISKKNEAAIKIIDFIERRENETEKRVKSVRSDNGREFINETLMKYYRKRGIKPEKTTAYSPQSNGLAERGNRTIINIARTLLIDAGLSLIFWAEAVWTAVYLHNLTPTAKREKTPMELWTGRKPTVRHLKIFGCKAFYRNNDVNRKKFDVRAKPAVFIGYSRNRQAYRLYDMTEERIKESKDVVFIEHEMGYLKNTDCDYEELDYVTIFPRREYEEVMMEQEPVQVELSRDRIDEEQENENVSYKDEDEINTSFGEMTEETGNNGNEGDEETEGNQKRDRRPPSKFKDYIVYNTKEKTLPKTYEEAMKTSEGKFWLEAMTDELSSMEANEVWKLVERPHKEKIIKSRWVFTKKDKDNLNTSYKARLVAAGYNQKKGKDYEEEFSPVMRFATFRTLLSIAAYKNYKVRFFDIKTAYLNGHLENPIYLEQPPGFTSDSSDPNKVYLVNKSIYGLPQSGRCWYEKLCKVLNAENLTRLKSDPCIHVYKDEQTYLIVAVYVDDLMIIGNSNDCIDSIIARLSKSFTIREVTQTNKFLGIEIKQESGKIVLSQRNYIQKILEKFKMTDCKPVKTPGALGEDLNDVTNSPAISQTEYQEALGSLMYLMNGTRPDLSFPVSHLSQFNKNPREKHWKAIKRIFRYLKGTENVSLVYSIDNGKLNATSDASWCTTEDGKSFGGYFIKLGNNIVNWKCRKQRLVTLSTMEAELLAFCDSACEIKWYINLLQELKQENLISTPVEIKTDSQALINWIKNPKHSSNSRHINRKYFFVKDEYEANEILPTFVYSEEQEADILTKYQTFEKLNNFMNSKTVNFIM